MSVTDEQRRPAGWIGSPNGACYFEASPNSPATALALALAAASTVAFACEGDPSPPPGPEPFFPADFESRYVRVRDCRFSIDHNSTSIAVYADPASADAYRMGRYPFAAGAIIVKKEHADGTCGSASGFTAMKSGASGWEWQRVDTARKVSAEDTRSCVTCHTSCTHGRDFTCTDP